MAPKPKPEPLSLAAKNQHREEILKMMAYDCAEHEPCDLCSWMIMQDPDIDSRYEEVIREAHG